MENAGREEAKNRNTSDTACLKTSPRKTQPRTMEVVRGWVFRFGFMLHWKRKGECVNIIKRQASNVKDGLPKRTAKTKDLRGHRMPPKNQRGGFYNASPRDSKHQRAYNCSANLR